MSSSLAVGHENHAILPIKILYAHTVQFTLVSHSRVAHQDDDVAEKLKSSPSPSAGLRSFEQLLFCNVEGARNWSFGTIN
jgi:hypothetical protein